jgi:amino acid transporter
MANYTVDKKILAGIAALGALISLIGVFVSWADMDVSSVVEALYSLDDSYSGWDLGNDDFGDFLEAFGFDDWQTSAGIAVFAMAILALICELATYCTKGNKTADEVLTILSVLFSLVALILCCAYPGWDLFDDYADVGAGCWTALVGAIITLIFAIWQFVEVYKE